MISSRRIAISLSVAMLTSMILASCQSRVYSFQLYPYPETADALGPDWKTLATVTESSYDSDGFRNPGERVINVQIQSSDGTVLIDRSIKFLGENDFELDGKWVSEAEFLLSIAERNSESTGAFSQMESNFYFHIVTGN